MQLAIRDNDKDRMREVRDEINKREKEFAAVSVDYLTMKPAYFNSGCCCFSDGDITGLEIEDGYIRLIKWKMKNEISQRSVLEEISLEELAGKLTAYD